MTVLLAQQKIALWDLDAVEEARREAARVDTAKPGTQDGRVHNR